MKPLKGRRADLRAARLLTNVGVLDRTLVIVESKELLQGQKRGVTQALNKAKPEIRKLERLCCKGRIDREVLERRAAKLLGREHLAAFDVTAICGTERAPTFPWSADSAKRRELQRCRLGLMLVGLHRTVADGAGRRPAATTTRLGYSISATSAPVAIGVVSFATDTGVVVA